MIKEYASTDNTQLTEHFNIQEFKCKCGVNHPIKHNPMLSEKLEQLFNKLDCSMIIVNSGHRCSEYDYIIGGSGTGQHVSGNAADIVCYDKNNAKISSKLVSCAAQDLGFGGIANIDWQYNATHVDVRESNFWYGNEVVTTASSVTSNFYDYYRISKDDSTLKGIDVSTFQDNIDWNSVDIDFCIIRAGYGRELSQKDDKLEDNYNGAKAHNIPVGVYWYSYATDEIDAVKEANACLEVLKGKQFEYPIFFDVEEQSQFNLGKAKVSAIIRAFCSTLEKAGYYVGLYMSENPLNNYVEDDILNKYDLWVANYSYKPKCECGMWQHSCKGKVNGINGDVDLNYCYKDYPEIIKTGELNGFGKVKPTKKVKLEIDGHTYEGEVTENG